MREAVERLTAAATRLALPSGSALRIVPVTAAAGPVPETLRSAAPRRRNTFAAGRRAAAEALAAAGSAGAEVGIGPDGLPLWPEGWMGSITHTDDIAAALVMRAAPGAVLGLDLEAMMTPDLARDIAPEIMPEGLSGVMPPELEVTRAFSAKEALYKALYPATRQFRDFHAAVIGWDGSRLTLAEDWGADWPAGRVLPVRQVVAGGHVLSVVWDGRRGVRT
ncbi:4'-phosphopantetheinyl transferase superfamily protein [Paracoccus sp. Z118]|uniref:4'-phosphopantetheinyl transferase family protein n=1 Tax=Paracoccus sp. Z118 TaxID=2851017 RepID=UPI001C2C41F7|nr:4'-phosphopantetheinyl transferase superfamily protein [Paracoccus sp. Z118]MBV0891413.1 4'-phosphopantetheinyl transferase superfamily protein [Paracoccus sp. Z118]